MNVLLSMRSEEFGVADYNMICTRNLQCSIKLGICRRLDPTPAFYPAVDVVGVDVLVRLMPTNTTWTATKLGDISRDFNASNLNSRCSSCKDLHLSSIRDQHQNQRKHLREQCHDT